MDIVNPLQEQETHYIARTTNYSSDVSTSSPTDPGT